MSRRIDSILTAAALLVRRGWTTGTEARDKRGKDVTFNLSEATRFDALGAIERACGTHPDARLAQVARARVERYLVVRQGMDPSWGLGRWNDEPDRTREEVVSVLLAARSESFPLTAGERGGRPPRMQASKLGPNSPDLRASQTPAGLHRRPSYQRGASPFRGNR